MFLDSDTRVALLSRCAVRQSAVLFLSNASIQPARHYQAMRRRAEAIGARIYGHTKVIGIVREDREFAVHTSRGMVRARDVLLATNGYSGPLAPWLADRLVPINAYMIATEKLSDNLAKSVLPADYATSIPGGAWRYANVDDLGAAAKQWPQIDFVIYHSALRAFLEDPQAELAKFEQTGRIEWVSDLAEIPAKFGVRNVYCDIGTSFAVSAVSNPRFCAAMMGTLVKGLGHDHIFWGTDAVWYGSPQWQIEALRRLEIPEDMQKRFGFVPLGPADGPVKSDILGYNAARHYRLDLAADFDRDGLGRIKAAYLDAGEVRTNLAYGFVVPRG